jgi:hypothetical protein
MTLLTDPVRRRATAFDWRQWFSLSKVAAFTSVLLVATAAIGRPDIIALAINGMLWGVALILALYSVLALVLGACVLAFGPSDD